MGINGPFQRGAPAGDLKQAIAVARGEQPADLVFKNAQFLDVYSGKFIAGDIAIRGEQIIGTCESYEGKKIIDASGMFIVPGFIDAHVHIESSMMTPARFQQVALPCGTTTVIWDPHEIANVWGKKGIEWALSASEKLLMDFFVMIPSCVPATPPQFGLETSGAELKAADIRPFAGHPRVLGLAEMMNFPGVLHADDEVATKLSDFSLKARDGHSPGLRGKDLNGYLVSGIQSCHESTQLEEAREKMRKGMHVLIREGSCAKDADALLPLVDAYSSAVLHLCSDDRNPADIAKEGHINWIIEKALRQGIAAESVFRVASWAPARAYGLHDRGVLAPGFRADFCLIKQRGKNWSAGFEVLDVYKNGARVDARQLQQVAEQSVGAVAAEQNIRIKPLRLEQLAIPATGKKILTRVIGVRPGQILTDALQIELPIENGYLAITPSTGCNKIAVIERHHASGNIGVGVVKGFALSKGAIATSVNHDSHNVIVVGADDATMVQAVERLQKINGGIVVTDGAGKWLELSLPVAGLMSEAPPETIAKQIEALRHFTKTLGCELDEPFLTLSFLALPVIPTLKITDRGLVDVIKFAVVPLF